MLEFCDVHSFSELFELLGDKFSFDQFDEIAETVYRCGVFSRGLFRKLLSVRHIPSIGGF
jgi:hypothetical protein